MDDSRTMPASTERRVLHIDMNAFYCACHAAVAPGKYAGRPTAVAGSPQTRHGVVVTASYEARARGVHATMTVAEALRACPELLIISPDFNLYRACSRDVFAIVHAFAPQVEIFSIDECWADVSGVSQFGTIEQLARSLGDRIEHELHLPCSIGVGPNKFVAKMASDLHKPHGRTVIASNRVQDVLWPLPIRQMFGIGAKTAERLARLGVQTIGDLATTDEPRLRRVLGVRGAELRQHANGIDDSPVTSLRPPPKSIGHEMTLSQDVHSVQTLETVLLNLCDQVGRRVRRHGMVGRTVQLTIRSANRQTVTRSRTLDSATDLTEDLWRVACQLLRAHLRSGGVRLVGVALSGLQSRLEVAQQSVTVPLFHLEAPGQDEVDARQRDRWQRLTKVTDQLRDRYGEDIVVRGRMLEPQESSQIRDRRARGTSLQKDNLEQPADDGSDR